MIHAVPFFVQAGIQAYDSALRLVWSSLSRTFVLQRKIQNAAPGSFDELMRTYDRRAKRMRTHEVRLATALSEGVETPAEEAGIRHTLPLVVRGRIDAGVRLEALRDGYQFVYWVPKPTANEPWAHRLKCILYTLRNNDVAATGGADTFHRQMQDDDAAETERLQQKRQSDIRGGASEVWEDIQRKAGERILIGKNQRRQPQNVILAGA